MTFRWAVISRKVTLPGDRAGIEFTCTHFERVFGRLVKKMWIDIASFCFSMNEYKAYQKYRLLFKVKGGPNYFFRFFLPSKFYHLI